MPAKAKTARKTNMNMSNLGLHFIQTLALQIFEKKRVCCIFTWTQGYTCWVRNSECKDNCFYKKISHLDTDSAAKSYSAVIFKLKLDIRFKCVFSFYCLKRIEEKHPELQRPQRTILKDCLSFESNTFRVEIHVCSDLRIKNQKKINTKVK